MSWRRPGGWRGVLAVLVCASWGCSIDFPQVEQARRMIVSGEDVAVDFQAYAWSLRWSGQTTVVYPVNVGDLTVFTNPAEVQIVFDGTQVRRAVDLLPRGRDVTIELGEGGSMVFVEAGIPVLRTECAPWREKPRAGGGHERLQTCADLETPNVVRVDEDGGIGYLAFHVHPAYPRVELRRNISATETDSQ